MKILITGSNGLLGQKIVYALLKLNNGQLPIGKCQWPQGQNQIIAASRGENRLVTKTGYTYIALDIEDPSAVSQALQQHAPDVIINTAAMTNVDACESQKEACWAANVTAVQNLVNSAEKLDNKPHLIHLSTDFIFDGEKGGLYVEEDLPNPLSYYALSKAESEKIVQSSTLRWSILRTIIVYGIVDNMSRSNIVLWAKGALEKGSAINVVDDQFRSPTLAEDLAQACILAALKQKAGIYNVSGQDFMSILDLVQRVARYWKLDDSVVKPIKSATLNQAAKRPPSTGFVIEKARRELGYVPHSFEEGLSILAEQLSRYKS